MSGAQIRCGDFEGEDKSGSPIGAVLSIAFKSAFGRKPRGRLSLLCSQFLGRAATGIEAATESALISINYDEPIGIIRPEVAAHLLPFLHSYQADLLARTGIKNQVDEIFPKISQSSKAKYGSIHDDGWHLYCLHDLVIACETSANTGSNVEVEW